MLGGVKITDTTRKHAAEMLGMRTVSLSGEASRTPYDAPRRQDARAWPGSGSWS